MQHPLTNPSLAPFGFVFPRYKERLDHKQPDRFWVNPERAMAKFWQSLHFQDSETTLPIETIIHTILPSMGTRWKITKGDFTFRSLPYLSRDIAVISTCIYWFGTNVGNCFLTTSSFRKSIRHDHEFLEKLRDPVQGVKDLVRMLTHVCNKDCSETLVDTHVYKVDHTSPRDRALIEGVMRWLGTKAGRDFIASWLVHIKQKQSNANHLRRNSLKKAA